MEKLYSMRNYAYIFAPPYNNAAFFSLANFFYCLFHSQHVLHFIAMLYYLAYDFQLTTLKRWQKTTTTTIALTIINGKCAHRALGLEAQIKHTLRFKHQSYIFIDFK